MAKRTMLGAMAMGCAAGFVLGGCAFAYLGTAKADNAVMVACDATGHATNVYSGLTPEQFAGISAVQISGSALQVLSPSADGERVSVKCGGPPAQVLFVSR